VVEALLAAGADVKATVGKGQTPLMSLVRCAAPITSRLKIACLLLAANCDVNQKTRSVLASLLRARCFCRDDEIARFLMEHGTLVTPKALLACFSSMDADASTTVELSCLLENGMYVDAKDADGRTAIHWAAANNKRDAFRLLLDHNADVSIQDRFGRTALMEAVRRGYAYKIDDDQLSIIQMLLERMNTVDTKLIDLKDARGYTALHFAASTSWQVVHELLNWGPDLLCQTSTKLSTALHCALDASDEPKSISIIRCLVEHANGYGLNGIDIQDKRGRTVLHLALENTDSNKSVIDYLSSKADVSIQNREGNTPLHIAVMSDLSEITLQMLRGRHSTEAANTLNGHGRTPLHDAVLRNNTDLVQAIGQIANVNIRSHDGKIALHYAVTEKATTCLELLLMLQANVLMRDNDGKTALALACNIRDDEESHSQLTMLFQLYKHGVAYGDISNMI